jgi:WD repeat-containing protein 17
VSKVGKLLVVDVRTRRRVWESEQGHVDSVFDIKFSNNDPNLLATCSYDATLAIWDVRRNRCLYRIAGPKEPLYSLSWSPDDSTIVCGGYTSCFFFDTVRGYMKKRAKVHPSKSIQRLAWCPRSDHLVASISPEDKELAIFESVDNVLQATFSHPDEPSGLCWVPGSKTKIWTSCANGNLYLWDLEGGSEARASATLGNDATSRTRAQGIHVSSIDPHLVCASYDDHVVRVWNSETAELVAELRGHTDKCRPVMFHPEIPWLVLSGSWDGEWIFYCLLLRLQRVSLLIGVPKTCFTTGSAACGGY